MNRPLIKIKKLAIKLMLILGVTLFASLFIWSFFTIKVQKKALFEKKVSDVDKFCNTVLNFTMFAMFHSPNEDMLDVLKNLSEYNKIERLRMFNTQGQVKFSNNLEEINTYTHISDVACKTCHLGPTPVMKKNIRDRIRIFKSEQDELQLGIISPILNEEGCSSAACHYHPADVKVLGTLDVVVSLEGINAEIGLLKKLSVGTSVYLFVILGLTVFLSIFKLVSSPIRQLISHTNQIGKGKYKYHFNRLPQNDEIGRLSHAIHDMGKKIQAKQDELNRQKDMYQNLFDQVPCSITVQDRDYKLLEFNKEFSRKFNPEYGQHCFTAYKKLDKKCVDCPVERTFVDGSYHFSEESGINKDGSVGHWFVKTAPLKDENGNIVAAMEMSIDISRRKKLEKTAKESEERYQAIFKSIPNPVFILNINTLEIIDCNNSASNVYGYKKFELIGRLFEDLFTSTEKFDDFRNKISTSFHEKLIHCKKDQTRLYVNAWVTPADFTNQKILLVTVMDITISVETQQQLIQAGKMATLGEMATGVAHELNQPLSVIKTASSFISRKIDREENIETDILATLSNEIETHVDRASKITSHMRLFGRKSVLSKEALNINNIIKSAFDIFSQQLKLREIEVLWNLDENLPRIMADPVRLEQVFINLLINARDSIVTRCKDEESRNSIEPDEKNRRITISTLYKMEQVTATISDTGTGISKEHIDKIFEPFFTTKKVGMGTGLGLSISYGIIKESGGDISVKNNEGRGVTFVIAFRTAKDTPK